MSTTLMQTATVLAEDGWDGPGAFWPVFPVFWLLTIVAIVVAVGFFRRRGMRMVGQRAGEARLAERYAAGEIGEQEYLERRAVLKEQS